MVRVSGIRALDAGSNPEGAFNMNSNNGYFALILKHTPITGINFVKSVDFWMYF